MSIEEIIRSEAADLLSGPVEEVKTYAREIALNLTQVTTQAEVIELVAQVRATGELARLHASQAAWETFGRVVRVVALTALV